MLNFICGWCAAAADLTGNYPNSPVAVAAVEMWRKELHDKCRGGTWCDCSRKQTK